MPRPQVLLKTSFLLSLCAVMPVQGQSNNNSSERSGKRSIAIGMPIPSGVSRNHGAAPQVIPRTKTKVQKNVLRVIASNSYPSTPLQRGLLLKQQGRIQEALLQFILSAQENPRQVRAFYEQALIFKKAGNQKFVISALEQALAISPNYSDARSMLAQSYFESGNLMGAAAQVGRLFNLNQDSTNKKKENANFLAYHGAPSAAIQIAKGNLPSSAASQPTMQKNDALENQTGNQTGNQIGDETSSWLRAAHSVNSGNSGNSATSNLKTHSSGSGTGAAGSSSRGQEASTGIGTVKPSGTMSITMASPDNSEPVHSNQETDQSEKRFNEVASRLGLPKVATEPAKNQPDHGSVTLSSEANTQHNSSLKPGALVIDSSADRSAADVLASLGVSSSASSAAESANNTPGSSAPKTAGAKSASSDAAGASLLAKMRGKTTQAANNLRSVASAPVPDWLKNMRAHIPFIPDSNSNDGTKSAAQEMPNQKTSAPPATPPNSVPKDSIKEQASSLMDWMRDRLSFTNKADADAAAEKAKAEQASAEKRASLLSTMKQSVKSHNPFISAKEKQNAQLSAKIKSAMEQANKGPQLSPEVARAIEAKLGITKQADPTKPPSDSQMDILKLAQAKLAETRKHEGKDSDSSHADSKSNAKIEFKIVDGKIDSKSETSPDTNNVNADGKPVEKNPSNPIPESKNNELIVVADSTMATDTNNADAGKTAETAKKNDASAEPAKPLSEEDAVKAVLASIGVSDASATPSKEDLKATSDYTSKPSYGLLGNTALKHINSLGTLSGPAAEKKPSLMDSFWKQAGTTFANMMPKIDWKLPSLEGVVPMFNKPEPSPESIVAMTDPTPVPLPNSEPAQSAGNGQIPAPTPVAAPTAGAPLPLDISRILGQLTPKTRTAPSPQAPPLSAIMPIAGPVNLDKYIPVPQDAPNRGSLPQMTPQVSGRSASKPVGPQTSPTVQTQNTLPPIVQEALNQAEPLIRPALNAVNAIAQTFNPTPLPIPQQQGVAPNPVDMPSQSGVNQVPNPVGADMRNFVNHELRPTVVTPIATDPGAEATGSTTTTTTTTSTSSSSTSSTSRRLISTSREKSGAFTFMKPVMDTDRNYILGAKQIRTIQPLPGKPLEAKPAPPEDAITKRMRYLMENGTSNLRDGEAFMFSEETGEGVLFLPGRRTERRKLQDSKDAEQVKRARRPDIMKPKDLQYSLSLLGKLMPTQNGNKDDQDQAVSGPTLEQLMTQMDRGSRSVFDWMKDTFKLP